MKLIEISRSVSRKINLGDYETKDYFCAVKYEVENEDEAIDASRKAVMLCEQEVLADIKELKEKIKARKERQ